MSANQRAQDSQECIRKQCQIRSYFDFLIWRVSMSANQCAQNSQECIRKQCQIRSYFAFFISYWL